MAKGNHQYILNAASNLLGISFILITGLKITKLDLNTFADEICLLSALNFLLACIFSYCAIRTERERSSLCLEKLADYLFLFGLVALFIAFSFFSFEII